MPFDVNEEKNASSTTKLLTASRPTNVLSTALYKTTNHKNELRKKLLGLQVFKNAQFQSVLIFFKFVHPFLLLYLLCVLISSFNVLSDFFMFPSFW